MTAKIWKVDSGELLFDLTGHSAEVTKVKLHNNLGITTSVDKSLRLWDTQNGECLEVFSDFSDEVLNAIFANVDGKDLIIACSSGGEVNIYDLQEKHLLYNLKGHEDEIITVLYNSTTSHFITFSSDR